MTTDGDSLKMEDGTEYYANRGIIGLDQNLGLSEGCDGCFPSDMPEAHRIEIAAYMVALWTRVLNGEPEVREW